MLLRIENFSIEKGNQQELSGRVNDVQQRIDNLKKLVGKLDGIDYSRQDQLQLIEQLESQIDRKRKAIETIRDAGLFLSDR